MTVKTKTNKYRKGSDEWETYNLWQVIKEEKSVDGQRDEEVRDEKVPWPTFPRNQNLQQSLSCKYFTVKCDLEKEWAMGEEKQEEGQYKDALSSYTLLMTSPIDRTSSFTENSIFILLIWGATFFIY